MRQGSAGVSACMDRGRNGRTADGGPERTRRLPGSPGGAANAAVKGLIGAGGLDPSVEPRFGCWRLSVSAPRPRRTAGHRPPPRPVIATVESTLMSDDGATDAPALAERGHPADDPLWICGRCLSRRLHRGACSACQATDVVPVDSPRGRQLAMQAIVADEESAAPAQIVVRSGPLSRICLRCQQLGQATRRGGGNGSKIGGDGLDRVELDRDAPRAGGHRAAARHRRRGAGRRALDLRRDGSRRVRAVAVGTALRLVQHRPPE